MMSWDGWGVICTELELCLQYWFPQKELSEESKWNAQLTDVGTKATGH